MGLSRMVVLGLRAEQVPMHGHQLEAEGLIELVRQR
jgi:hypothetical protein